MIRKDSPERERGKGQSIEDPLPHDVFNSIRNMLQHKATDIEKVGRLIRDVLTPPVCRRNWTSPLLRINLAQNRDNERLTSDSRLYQTFWNDETSSKSWIS